MYEYDPKLQREYAAKQLGIKKPAGNVGSFEEPTLTENRGGVDLYSYKPKEQENLLSYAAKKYKSAVGALEEDVAKPIGEALKATAAAGSPLQEQPQYLPPETTQAVEKFAKSVEKDLTEHGQEWKASDKSASVADFEKENPIAAPIASVVSSTPATVARMAPYFTELGIPLIAGKAIKEGAEVEGDVYDKAKAIAGNVAKEAATVATLGATGKMAGFTKRALANTGTMALRSQVDRVQAGGKADMETLAEDFAYSMPAGMIFAAPRIKTDRAVKKLNQELDLQAAKMKAGQDANTSQAIDAMSSGVKKLAEDVAYGRMEKPESISLTPEFKEQFGLGNKKVSEPKKSVGAAGQDLTTSAIPLTELPKEPITVKTEAGVKTTITPKQGEEFTVTPYKTSDGKVKFELHDGESYTVTKNTATELVNKFGLVERDFSIPKELEVVKKGGDKVLKLTPEEQRRIINNRDRIADKILSRGETKDTTTPELRQQLDRHNELIRQQVDNTPTKFSEWQLAKGQGAKNYREVLLKAPTKEPADFPNKAVFKSSHWDEPNVIAHTRLAEHTPKSGGQTTLMEELQSDWAREGRDKGFNTEPPRGMEAWEQDGKWFVGSKDTGAALRESIANTREEAIAKTYATGMYQNAGVPHHPALKNWTEHGLKHAIKEAVDAGSDTLSWVTGKQTADRYDLSKQVDEIAYDKNADGSYRIQAFKNNPDLPVIEKDVAEKDLASVVGKDVAQKIISGDGKQDGDLKVLSGKDLMVSAGWTTNLYDRQIPNLLKDLTKGYGTQFKDITLENGETVHSMTLTPRLKAAFQKDQGTVGAMSKGGKADTDLLEEARKYKTAEEFIKSQIEKHIPSEKYADWGIRVIDKNDPIKIGDRNLVSNEWRDNEKTGDLLNGVSVLDVRNKDYLDLSKSYIGDRIAIIKGTKSESGYDVGESVLKDNEVVDIINPSQLTSIWNEANKKSVGARGKDIPSDSVPIELPPKVEINTLDGKKTISPKAGEPFTVDAIQEANGKVTYQLHDGVTEDISPKEANRLITQFKPIHDVLGEVNNIFAEPEEVKQPLGRKLLELSDKAKQHIYREYQPLNRLEADIYKTYGVDRPKMPLANKFELVKGAGGKADADRIEFGERVIKPIEHLYESDVDAYFFLKRTIDRLTKDADKRKVGTFTIEKAQNGLAQLRSKLGDEDFAKLEKAAIEYQKLMNDALQLQVKTGGMSVEEYNNIKALNDFYAPFQVVQDVNEKEYTGAGKSVSGAKKLTKSIKGISSDDFRLKNIMTSSLEQITMGRILSEKRLAMQELDKLADIDINKTFIRREIAEPTGKIEALNNRLVKLAELQEKQRQLQIQRDSLDAYRRSLYGKQVARRQAARTAAQQIDLDKGKSTVESRISLSPLFRAGRIQTPEMKRVWKQQIAEINKSIQQEQRVPEASIPFLQGLRSEMEAYIESTPDIKKAIRRLGGISPLKEAQSWGLTGEIKSLKESDLSLFNNKGLSLDRMAGAISDEFPHVYPERLTPGALINEIWKANLQPQKYTARDIKLLDRVLAGKISANDIPAVNQLLEQINSEITAMGEEPIKPAVDKLQEGLKFAKGQYSMPVVNKGLFRKLTLLENKLADYRETSLAEQAAMLDEVREMVNNKDVTITEARDLLKRVSGQLAAEKVNVAATKAKSAAEKMAIRTNYKLRSKRFKDLEEKIKNTETYLNRVAKGSILIQDKVPLPTGWERVSFLKNGNVVTLQVKQDVAEAVKGLNAQQTGMIRTILQMGAVPLRWGATGVNAGFQFFNMLFRDPARLALISKMGLRSPLDLVRFPIEWIHSLYSAMKLNFGTPNQLAEEFLRNGMGGGTAAEYFDPTAFAKKYGFKKDLTVKDVVRKVVMLPKDVLDFLAKLGNVGEQTTKLLGYKRGKRIFGINQLEGKAAEEATKELAWEVRNMAGSPDFSQGGNTTKQLNSVFMFLNARVRAMQTDFARLGGSHGAGPAGAAWGRLGLLIGLPTTLLMMYNLKDDNKEDYQKRPEWERKNYWLVPRYDENGKPLYFTNEDGDQVREYYRWPKNDILQVVANSIEGGVQFAYSKDPEALKSLGVDLLENISPITIQGDDLTERTQSVLASMNPMISVPVSWATNKNLRLHSDTVPMSKQGASPYLQSRQSTPEFYKQIGRAFAKTDKDTGELVGGISPAKLEQAVGNFTGGAFGQFVLPEKVEGRSPLSVLPVAKRVFGGARIEEPEIKSLEKMLTRQADRRVILKDKAIEFIKATKNMPPGEGNRQYAEIEKSDPQLAEKIAEVKFEMDKGFSRDDQLLKQLGIENGARAKWLHDKTKNMTPEDRQSYLEGYWNKGLITDDVVNQLRELKK